MYTTYRAAASPAACFLTTANCQKAECRLAGCNIGEAIRPCGQDVKAAGCCSVSGQRQVGKKEKTAELITGLAVK